MRPIDKIRKELFEYIENTSTEQIIEDLEECGAELEDISEVNVFSNFVMKDSSFVNFNLSSDVLVENVISNFAMDDATDGNENYLFAKAS